MKTAAPRPLLVILISGRGANLRSIVAARADGSLECDIAGVISNRPDAAGLAWAAGQGIATTAVDHRAFGERAAFDVALAQAVQGLVPAGCRPWVVLAGFMRILGEGFISRHDARIVNIHPSLLPAYPGLHTHRQALADGALLHGATVHLVTSRLDHGPIVAQAVVPVLGGDDEGRLAERVMSMEHLLYPLALQWLVASRTRVEGGRILLDGIDAAGTRVLWHPLLRGPVTPSGPTDT